MMTFKEYLTESSIMSNDALQLAMRDYDKRGLGKTDGSKPDKKRLDQLDKRKNRKLGKSEEEEEANMPAVRDRVKRIADQPKERGKQRPSMKRQYQRGVRSARSSYGIGGHTAKNAATLDD